MISKTLLLLCCLETIVWLTATSPLVERVDNLSNGAVESQSLRGVSADELARAAPDESPPIELPIIEPPPPRRDPTLSPQGPHTLPLMFPLHAKQHKPKRRGKATPKINKNVDHFARAALAISNEASANGRTLLGSKDGSYLWLVGLTLGLLACGCNALGMVMQRKAHEDAAQWLTWVGIVLMGLAGILDFASFAFAAQSLIAPLGSLTLVANALLSHWLLNDKLHFRGWLATLVIVMGCGAAVMGASHDSKVHSASEFISAFSSLPVLAYSALVITIVAMGVGVLLSIEQAYPSLAAEHPPLASTDVSTQTQIEIGASDEAHGEKKVPQPHHTDAHMSVPKPGKTDNMEGDHSTSTSGCGVGCSPAVPEGLMVQMMQPASTSISTQMISTGGVCEQLGHPCSKGSSIVQTTQASEIPSTPTSADTARLASGCVLDMKQVHAVLHGIIAGLVGAQSLIFGKTTAEMLVLVIDRDAEGFNPVVCSLAFLLMVLTVVTQLFTLNRGLRFHSALLVVPVYQTFWTLAGVVGGAVCFNEFGSASAHKLALFAAGALMMLSSLWYLISSKVESDAVDAASDLAAISSVEVAAGKKMNLDCASQISAVLDI